MLITDRFKKVFLGAVAIVIVFIVSGVFLFSNVARAPELVEVDSLAKETEVLPLDRVMNKKPNPDDGSSTDFGGHILILVKVGAKAK